MGPDMFSFKTTTLTQSFIVVHLQSAVKTGKLKRMISIQKNYSSSTMFFDKKKYWICTVLSRYPFHITGSTEKCIPDSVFKCLPFQPQRFPSHTFEQ